MIGSLLLLLLGRMELVEVAGNTLVVLVTDEVTSEALQHFNGVGAVVRVSVGELCRGDLSAGLGEDHVYSERLAADVCRDLREQCIAHVLCDRNEMRVDR